ncbi:alpha/beta hydrolase [Congregibacter litoralis]|uniref:Dienelactone hydrolase n=1 Tax=Congregibacter litoralis KT71 TaxID=314285 RepID=A4A7Z3_9GAMM|nr:alpha/beta hydrolase [Congregibacter litoralis]EAQ97788.1 Dienelactone hydrolase [Congregibacter litoralis KT71]
MKRQRSRHSDRFWPIGSLTVGLTVMLLSAINVALMDTGLGNVTEFFLGLGLGLVAVITGAIVVALALKLTHSIPFAALSVGGGSIFALWYLNKNSPARIARTLLDDPQWQLDLSRDALSFGSLTGLVLTLGLLAGIVFLVWKKHLTLLRAAHRGLLVLLTVSLITVSAGTLWSLMSDGHNPYPDDGAFPELLTIADDPGNAGNPAAPGLYTVKTLTYGAGNNLRRPEFGSNRDIDSRTVDARKLLPQWVSLKKRMRESYWGFGLEEAPLNGRVWMPEGAGPFPLVLIVHGNHGMEDYSDDGYAYLGELLANRGFITVSVDQNYINGSWSGDFQGKEMAARGWLLLEHLAQWRDWNQTPGHPLGDKIDMNRLALIGHSRGGEAVSIAHSFNRLSHFPDDATVAFDYGFNIRALVAIAQVDQRYHRRVKLQDVDFFTIHGSYDSDEPAYHGLRQMNRISLSTADYHFKAGVYVHGANHGQFNSGWGRYDYSPPGAWSLNTAPIIPGEDQRKAAKIYISAFLEASLHGDGRFLSYLKDPRSLSPWLPRQSYVHQFMDSSFAPIADFEEDIDTATGSADGARISVKDLALWREEALQHRDKRLQGSNAVVLGWETPGASYLISNIDTGLITTERSLVFAVSGSLEKSAGAPSDSENAETDDSAAPTVPDFSVSLIGKNAQEATVLVSDFAQLIPPVRVQYLKNARRNKAQYHALWEPVLQYVEIPFAAFTSVNPSLSLEDVRSLRLDFDQSAAGVLILDNIGSARRL